MKTIITARKSINGYIIVEESDDDGSYVYDIDNFDGFAEDFIFPEWNKKFNKMTITFDLEVEE